jgi:hypothetical protein
MTDIKKVDGNLITNRKPGDISAVIHAIQAA